MIARFVTRSDGSLLIGSLSQTQKILEPDTVYSINEHFGVLTITKVGQSIIPVSRQDTTEGKEHNFGSWNSKIGDVLASAGSMLLVSIAEYKAIQESEE